MKITVFTSNNPRHISLIEDLCGIADEVFACMESVTLFPGQVDDFYRKSPVMADYFKRVIAAEAEVFGRPRFLPSNARALPMRLGDLSMLSLDDLAPALDADLYVVFGASYVKGPLIDLLIQKKAVNIHMGVSPYFRGDSCNFWAIRDQRADLVGGTIHYLTKGLDSGPMLFHALPLRERVDPFLLGMKAVRAAHRGLAHHIEGGSLFGLPTIPQDRAKEIRYSRHLDFSDNVAANYLRDLPTPEAIEAQLRARREDLLWNPYVASA